MRLAFPCNDRPADASRSTGLDRLHASRNLRFHTRCSRRDFELNSRRRIAVWPSRRAVQQGTARPDVAFGTPKRSGSSAVATIAPRASATSAGDSRETPARRPAAGRPWGEEAEGGWPQRYCARVAQCVRPSRGLLQSVSVAGASSPTAPALGAAGSSSAT